MATENAFTQDDDPRKKKGTQDPLFYEGKTPVLGEDVSVQEPAGELNFPEASGSPPASPGGAAGPTGPPFPAFPEFNLEAPEFNFNPSKPPTPPEVQLPQMDVPWWQEALQIGNTAADKAMAAKSAYDKTMALGAPPTWAGADPNFFSLTGDVPAEWFSGQEGSFNLTGEGLPQGAMDPANYNLGGESAVAPGISDIAGGALSAVGTGLGIYGAINAEPGSPQQLSSSIGAVGGGLTLASTLGLLGPAWAAAGPYAALATLPLVSGMLWQQYGPPSADKILTPPGWTYVPGTGNSRGVGGYVVDPASGRVVQYMGKGKYVPFGIMSPEQFQQYQIEPTGKLAEHPKYAGVPKAIRDRDITSAGHPVSPGGAPNVPSQAHQRAYLEEWRQPYIDQIRAQHPNDPDSRIWWYYTQSPWYQQELNLIAQWGATGQPGGGGEAEGSGPSGPGDRAGDLGGGLMG